MNEILFIGSTRLSGKLLEKIYLHEELKIVGIVTGEENFKISYSKELVQNYNYEDLEIFANRYSIPFFRMTNGMKDPNLRHWVSGLQFDFVLVVGWYHMIPGEWIQKYKCLGIHASLLPNYRGGAPLVWALINGEKETGVSMFLMDTGVDTGSVVAQKRISISDIETIGTLLEKVEKESIQLCLETLPVLEATSLNSLNKVSDNRKPYPQRKPRDGKVQFPHSLDSLKRFIRAQSRPYPGAYLEKNGKKLYLWNCDDSNSDEKIGSPGEVFFINSKIVIQCLDGTLRVSDFFLVENTFKITEYEKIVNQWC